jgi:hypothetical protein
MQLLGGSGICRSEMELEAIFQNTAILRSSMKVLEADSLTKAPHEPLDYQFPDPQGERRAGRIPVNARDQDNGVIVFYSPDDPDKNLIAHSSFIPCLCRLCQDRKVSRALSGSDLVVLTFSIPILSQTARKDGAAQSMGNS